MSVDLIVLVSNLERFSEQSCAGFMSRYGFGLEFPSGFDLDTQEGVLPCRLVGLVGSRQTVDTCIEVDLEPGGSPGEGTEILLATRGDEFEWMLAHALGAYFVSELGATLEDPQEGTSYSASNAGYLDALVSQLLSEAVQTSA